ncbi:MAG: acyl carrier protein [Bacteroidales bacterium]|nr:acyl carrier protein [Bacteroidales bacterium]
MEEKVLEILKNVFELDTVDTTCSQQTCEKWDSMGQLNLVVELESEFDISLEPEEIGEMTSFQDIIRILNDKGIKNE